MKRTMILLWLITLGPGAPPAPLARPAKPVFDDSVLQSQSADEQKPVGRIAVSCIAVSCEVEVQPKNGKVMTASVTDFAPTTLTVAVGKLKAGDASSVAAQDGVVLKIKSVMLDGSFGDIVEYDFNTDLNPTTPSITFAVIQRTAIAPQGEQLSVFNFSTQSFEFLAQADLRFSSTTTTLSITNPRRFISDSGELRLQVRVGDMQTEPWKHLIDQVSLTAE
jgi:hypothetical protein